MQLPNYAYTYSFIDDETSRLFMYSNFINFISKINNVYKLTKIEAEDVLDSTTVLLYSTILVLEIIALLIALGTQPIYSII